MLKIVPNNVGFFCRDLLDEAERFFNIGIPAISTPESVAIVFMTTNEAAVIPFE